MAVRFSAYESIREEVHSKGAILVAVSKTRPSSDILGLLNAGQLDFGENYVQELQEKQEQLPDLIRWHFIGHLQSNKAKYIVPFTHLIHGVDSISTLDEINKQALKSDRVSEVLLQVRIAKEETKFGILPEQLSAFAESIASKGYLGVRICGLMGMATNTEDESMISSEFKGLRKSFDQLQMKYMGVGGFDIKVLSMGMTSDYRIALEEGSTMVRIGSAIFGERKPA